MRARDSFGAGRLHSPRIPAQRGGGTPPTAKQLRVLRGGAKHDAGFALLMTLVLVAFLVLLLVGLATYTRIETAITGNQQRQAQARENAVFALQVAIGQLQAHAGADTRVTATGEGTGNTAAKNYTGVWDSTTTGLTPRTWLVSGSERADATPEQILAAALDPASNTTADQEFLVGSRSVSAPADRVKVAKQDITAVGVPGQTGAVRIGRYAWWVGDQGVKAPVAVADTTDAITFAPYDSADMRARIRQQVGFGAGAAFTAATVGASGFRPGDPFFEPHDSGNSPLVANGKITSMSQISFLNFSGGLSFPAKLVGVQQNFHAWSPNNFNVLANPKLGGLRQDLSLRPDLLGAAFDAWRNYDPLTGGYMEDPAAPLSPVPDPPYDPVPVRRRYRMTPPAEAAGAVHGVAPVLGFFGLSFSIRESGISPPNMEVASRCVVSLWNPYTSSLVPESLKMEITGLPLVRVEDSAGGNHPFPLQSIMGGGGPMVLALDWTPSSTEPDRASWLPGRTYAWAAPENLSPASTGIPMVYHEPDATPTGAGQGIVRQTGTHHHLNPPGVTTPLTRTCETTIDTRLQIRLLRASDDVELARYEIVAPQFGPTSPIDIDGRSIDFAFIARLPERDELPTGATQRWLSAPGRDPRSPAFPGGGFISGANGNDPAAYGGTGVFTFVVRDGQRLLDRGGGRYGADEDVPLFELPRSPLLSLGTLQHLQLAGARPFSIGNSWGGALQLNAIPAGELFDRFFFSGAVPGVVPNVVSGAMVLPNPLLKVLRNGGTGVAVDVAEFQAAPEGQSSKFLLQGGAFNLNSVNPAAWSAVLRAVRFPAPQSYTFLEPNPASGSTADAALGSVQSGDAQFFRFAQSAHETYRADETYVQNTVSGVDQFADTHLFRRGMKTLTSAQVTALAGNIVAHITERQGQKGRYAGALLAGPFRSAEEFLQAPLDSTGSPLLLDAAGAAQSLIERAIADTDINATVAQFSSQFLTQADIMTALAPVLFPRSDTFVIRAYGEAVNPATNATEGRAWCEATVQRVPDYMEPPRNPGTATATGDAPEVLPANLTSELNRQLGRRFKIVSFRWLTRSDI